MGGDLRIIGQLFGNGIQDGQQIQAPQYDDGQLLKYAQDQKGNYNQFKAYNTELVNQLRNNTYRDPYKVWQSVRSNQQIQAQPTAQPIQNENQSGVFGD